MSSESSPQPEQSQPTAEKAVTGGPSPPGTPGREEGEAAPHTWNPLAEFHDEACQEAWAATAGRELLELEDSFKAIEVMERLEWEAVLALQAEFEAQELSDLDAAEERDRQVALQIQKEIYGEQPLEQPETQGNPPEQAADSQPGEAGESSTTADNDIDAEVEEEDPEEELCMCPITQDIMTDPVILVGDGHTYERHAIEGWLAQKSTSPMSGADLAEGGKALISNYHAKAAIEAWSARKK